MRRFHPDAARAGGPARQPDEVLLATHGFAMAASGHCCTPTDFGDALQAFRLALRRRFYREVTLGLPADVVRHVMACAVRLAVDGRYSATGVRQVLDVAAATLAQAERAFDDDVLR